MSWISNLRNCFEFYNNHIPSHDNIKNQKILLENIARALLYIQNYINAQHSSEEIINDRTK